MCNIVNSLEYKQSRVELDKYYREGNLESSRVLEIEDLPERYTVISESYKTGEHTWSVIKLSVVDTVTGKDVTVKRNYSAIDVVYCRQNGKNYILTGEDYQGYTLIDLDKMERFTYIPEGWLNGSGWCPIRVVGWNEIDGTLEVIGCIWGGEYTRRIYTNFNFKEPNFEEFNEIDEDA